MVGTKKSERILIRTYLPKCQLRLSSQQGFSLIEIAVVMIIIGLIMTAGVTIFRSSILSTKLSTTKTNLDNIKTSVISFAMANGRLACPDSTIPPNNTGQSNPVGAGICAGCANPPCYVPFQTLQLSLPGGKDSFGNVFRYDVSYEPAGGGGLTNTTQDTFCGVLFEYLFHATDIAPSAPLPIVTNQNDGADDGQIGAAGQGYGVAAVAISETPVDSFFNASAGLTGKNIAGTPREYEMAVRANDNTYGNLLSELTYGDLYNRVCTTLKTKIRIQNNAGAPQPKYANISGMGCMTVANAALIDIPQGSTVTFYDSSGCTTNQCGIPITFNMLLTSPNDAGRIDWGPGGQVRDGIVQITGACVLSNN
ncbi:MAG: type II secretion system protein [Deltaproteobacteria bacterium]|nr:MAG: type II secretion system protein [Deltaproteobacteria bacterium]